MHNGNVAYKGFVICIVLFCAYMQWSPVVDLDYVSVNGHEHYVGAANPHEMGMVAPIILRPVRTYLEDFAPHLLPLPVERKRTPCTVLLSVHKNVKWTLLPKGS
jgi:hypothetical protein